MDHINGTPRREESDTSTRDAMLVCTSDALLARNHGGK
jgi:hypothetical protein